MDHLNAVLARIGEIRDRFDVTEANAARANSGLETGRQPSPIFADVLDGVISGGSEAMPSGPVKFEELIKSASDRYNLPCGLLKAVVHAESGFKPNVVSRSGAMGLTQLMPGTARALGVSDPFDPAQNIEGGAKYLRQQIDRFGDVSLALAAYNAGPGAVARHGGVPPFTETQNYVKRVIGYSRAYGME